MINYLGTTKPYALPNNDSRQRIWREALYGTSYSINEDRCERTGSALLPKVRSSNLKICTQKATKIHSRRKARAFLCRSVVKPFQNLTQDSKMSN